MPQNFYIAESNQSGSFHFLDKKCKVTEGLFYKVLNSKVRELVIDLPEQYDDALKTAQEALKAKQALTVVDTYFQVKGNPDQPKYT